MAYVLLEIVVIWLAGLAGFYIYAFCAALLDIAAENAGTCFDIVLCLADSAVFWRSFASETVICLVEASGAYPIFEIIFF